ncbi:MAG TPA: FIST N-terminal domain-containing protein [Thermoleophilaceae bacterium]|nr:FIST N-terminal domain-containing protein [Thermoleophilaceae bacterium]
MTRIATGLSAGEDGASSYAEAAEQALAGLGEAEVDLAVVFAGPAGIAHAAEGLEAVTDRLAPGTLIGCGAQGVLGGGREYEQGGVAVWAASLPGASVEAFGLDAVRTDEESVAITGVPDLTGAAAVILLVDPYSFPIEPLLDHLADDHAGVPVVGGIASAGGGPGAAVLMHDHEIRPAGAVGVALTGVEVLPCVSQGARPVGPEMVITAGEGNVIGELAGKPAFAKIREVLLAMPEHEREMVSADLLLGIVVDPNKPEYVRGDFLVRGLLGANGTTGEITVGDHVRVGQAVRLHTRDAASAHEDLRETLAAGVGGLGGTPAGALLFTCSGRGAHMFEVPDHDAGVLAGATGGAPAAGFFCAGEIGPVGERNFVHGFTATMALFR